MCLKVYRTVTLALLLIAGDVESNPGPETNEELNNHGPDTRHSSVKIMMSRTNSISDFELSQNSKPAAKQPEITEFFKKTAHLPSPGPPPPGNGSNLKRKKQSRRKSAQKMKKPSAAQGTSPQGTSPQGRSPQGTSPQGTSLQGTSPQGTSPRGTSPQGTSPQGTSPQGTSPQRTSPQGTSLQHTSPQGTSSQGTSPLGGRVGRWRMCQRKEPEESQSSRSEENLSVSSAVNQLGRNVLSRPVTVHPATDFQFPVHGPIPTPLVTSSFSIYQPAMVPHLQQFLTHPVQEPTFQIFQPARSPLVTCVPNLQPHFTHYGSGMFQEMQQREQLPPVLPIQSTPFPYIDNHYATFTQPFQSLPAIISCPPAEIDSVVSSNAAYQAEVLPAPFPPSLPQSGPLNAVSTTLSAASSHNMTQSSYCTAHRQEISIPMRESQTADITPNVEQTPPKEKKECLLLTTKPKVEWSPKEPEYFKVEQKRNFKLKQEFSACDIEKGEQLAAENKLLHDVIYKLKQQIAEKDERIARRDQEFANQAGQNEYLRGFETFATTSIIVPNNHSHSFVWQKHGLKLHIPAGAVPEEHTEYKVDIKIGFSGQFNIPITIDDLQLVSCVYWLSCPLKFQKPVRLEIEHCVSLYDRFQPTFLRFVAARCCQVELPYQFRVLEKGTFVAHSSFGSIQVSQFSFFGIVIPRRFLSLQRYRCIHHYIRKDVHQWDVDFIITTGLEASLTAIEERYSSFDTISGPDFEVQFEKDEICLSIPGDGLHLNGWEITPLVPLVIAKQQVDAYKPGQKGQRVPYCRLQVKLKIKDLTELEHKVELQGAKSPWNFFTITCPPKEHIERHARVMGGKRKLQESEQEGVLMKKRHLSAGGDIDRTPCKPQLKSLMDALYHKVADKWKMIGVLLEISKGKLAGISEQCRGDPHKCLLEMLETWLERVDPPATWATIIEAVEFLGEEQLGKELREKHTQ